MSNDHGAPVEPPNPRVTHGEEYTQRLEALTQRRVRRVPGAQIPYSANIRRHCTGRTLDVGCGIGRNLVNLRGAGIGVDHNPTSVGAAQEQGLTALTTKDFLDSEFARPNAFDSMLIAHVLEHIDYQGCVELLKTYVQYVRPRGTVMMICPQERGFAIEDTHIHWVDTHVMAALATEVGLEPVTSYSFPFPRFAGRLFTHNEFCSVHRVPAP